MTTTEELQLKIRDLEKEVARLNTQIKKQRYGLNWLDVPEEFDTDSENRIPILEEAPELAIKNNDGKPTHILIEGDNYHALTCLNYTHRGKIDVIYIDPPYNTGSDGFTYKDKRILAQYPDGTPVPTNHPLRHSYWLSFMSKRLELAKNLLSDKGVIFISIDDNEQANLKLLCDKVFQNNFVGQIIWQSATDNNPRQISTEHEYILCYCKRLTSQGKWLLDSEKARLIQKQYLEIRQSENNISEIQKKLRIWIKKNKDVLSGIAHYNNVDDKGVYSNSSNSSNTKPGGYTFDILHPATNKPCPKPIFGWRWTEETFLNYQKNGDVDWGVDETTQPHIKKRLETTQEQLKSIYYEDGRSATKNLENIFGTKKIFNNPKPIHLIERLTAFTSSKHSTILDFFAGSGTTLHATMKLNEDDGGKRQCILVQQKESDDNNICRDITYERNRRMMQGYTDNKGNEVAGIGNSMKYYRTSFVGKNRANEATDTDKVLLSLKAGCLLALGENTLEEIVSTSHYQIFTDGEAITAVYFTENSTLFDSFIDYIRESKAKSKAVYIFSWSNGEEFSSYFDDMKEVTLKSIPKPILDIYKTLNR